MASSNEVKEEYASSLRDLTFNSKPLISVLTILAEENIAHAKDIVEVIENHLARVRTEVKLPVLYLIDCIIKNVGRQYTSLFCQNIVSTFCSVFEQVDEKTRSEMFRLRQTWNDVLPPKKLYALDVQIQQLDPAWPVTAPPPNNSIHFNPKFLKTAPAAVSKASPGNIIPVTNVSSVDPETLSMQQKLINKQKELLELQQRKLELELLQTQVRLQEQLKNKNNVSSAADTKTVNALTTSQKTSVPHSQNILLKPGAIKEINTSSARPVHVRLKNSQNISTMKNQRFQQQQQQQQPSQNIPPVTSPAPRIAPVNSVLVNAQRPTRDPRLLRLQEKQQQEHQQQNMQASAENVNSNVHLESKSKSASPQMIHSENKVVTNKMSVRDNRTEPRSVSSKNKTFGQGKNKTIPRLSSPSKSSPPKPSTPTSPKKSSKFSRSSKSSSSASDLSSSSSSIDSPSKSKNGFYAKNRSPNKSPQKNKKKSSSNSSTVTDSEKGNQKEDSFAPCDRDAETVFSASENKDVCFDKKSDKLPKIPKSDKVNKTAKSDMPTSIKEVKISSKNRNYIRRNRETSVSPEPPHDVDLRISAPPEKQPRLQGDSTDTKNDSSDITNMDVDLRQLPAVIGKKRPSSEGLDSPSSKKSKSELFDVLFGSEDTDLRQLPPVLSPPRITERPKTPPPPIISEIKETATEPMTDAIENKETEKKDSPKKANLDVLRAKLANATHREKLEKARLHFAAERSDTRKQQEDTDMRTLSSLSSSDLKMDKIIISPADEQSIKAGNMTKAQETALMNKIIAQIETQKLREAQRKESENIANVSLQPISDDELEVDGDFSGSEGSESEIHSKPPDFGDKDDRVVPLSTGFGHIEDNYPKSRNLESRDMRRHTWRGRRGRPIWDSHPSAPVPFRPNFRGRPEPWMRMPNPSHGGPWRPMNAGFVKPHIHLDNFTSSEGPIIPHGNASPNAFPTNEEAPGDIVFSQTNEDSVKTINIDGIPRIIRYYDETAVIFMNWDDPREISFQNGSRRITVDDKETYLLSFNDPYREIPVNGNLHKVRFGGPTKEIFIDGKGYECYFGSPGIGVEIDGNVIHIQLEGPPPQVKIGNDKRTDLVGGKINLIIDAKMMVPIYLDGKLQQFELDGKIHTLKFVDALKKVIINDISYPVEFGGLPKPVTLFDKKHFIRFSVLPKGIKPGRVSIKDMEVSQMPESSPRIENESSQDGFINTESSVNEPVLPIIERRKLLSPPEEEVDKNSNDPQAFQNFIQQQNFNNLDLLSNVMAPSVPSGANVSNYQIEGAPSGESQTPVDVNNTTTVSEEQPRPIIPPIININDLFQKLVATGIVTTAISAPASTNPPETPVTSTVTQPKPHITTKNQKILAVSKPVYFDKPDTLKMRQSSLIQALYVGMQCSSCGMRFPPELSMHYSQHLDWHFRQNRRGKKNIRKAASRRWYYTLPDWKNFEEIEDIEEREKSYFENQSHNEGNVNEEEEEIEIPSVPADPDVQDASCEVCKEKFEQFYNEEKEEWHLRMAVRIEGKTYHPLCHEDYLASLVDQTVLDDNKLSASQSEDEDKKENIPGLEVSELEPVVLDDDEELEIVEENSVLEIKETSKEEMPEESTSTEKDNDKQEGEDDDVIINEVIPEKIVVDDDGEEEEQSQKNTNAELMVVKEEPIDDGFIDVENGLLQIKSGGEVKIKTEPVDPDELMVEDQPEEERPGSSQGHVEFKPSIDGNVEYESSNIPTTSAGISGKIKINISKPIVTVPPKEKEATVDSDTISSATHDICIDPSQPLPPGEEPVQLNIKPALQGIPLRKLPVVKKGTELTGLCSIM